MLFNLMHSLRVCACNLNCGREWYGEILKAYITVAQHEIENS